MQKSTITFLILVASLFFSASITCAQSVQPVSVNPDTFNAERAAAIEDVVYRAFESEWIGMEAGVVAEIVGEVQATDKAGKKRKLAKDNGLQNGDTVSTYGKAHIIIAMPDGSMYSLGPDSTMMINEFTFDEGNPQKDTTDITIKQGVFRYKTGGVASRSPEAIMYRTPSSVAGVLGSVGWICVKHKDETIYIPISGSITIRGKSYNASDQQMISTTSEGVTTLKVTGNIITRLQKFMGNCCNNFSEDKKDNVEWYSASAEDSLNSLEKDIIQQVKTIMKLNEKDMSELKVRFISESQ